MGLFSFLALASTSAKLPVSKFIVRFWAKEEAATNKAAANREVLFIGLVLCLKSSLKYRFFSFKQTVNTKYFSNGFLVKGLLGRTFGRGKHSVLKSLKLKLLLLMASPG